MYPHELENYINTRNNKLISAEVAFITNINLHPQLNHITYNPWDCSYDMWDCEGNHYHFIALGSR